jgi:hypothetical protein
MPKNTLEPVAAMCVLYAVEVTPIPTLPVVGTKETLFDES